MKKYLAAITFLLFIACINSCKKKVEPKETFTRFPTPQWSVDESGKYPVSMTAVVTLPGAVLETMQPDDKIGAFIKEECRGLGVMVSVDSAKSVFYVMIRGTSVEQDKIKFMYYSTKTSYIHTTTEFLPFTVDGNFGTVDVPEVLDVKPMN